MTDVGEVVYSGDLPSLDHKQVMILSHITPNSLGIYQSQNTIMQLKMQYMNMKNNDFLGYKNHKQFSTAFGLPTAMEACNGTMIVCDTSFLLSAGIFSDMLVCS